jgi:hypothetical protein
VAQLVSALVALHAPEIARETDVNDDVVTELLPRLDESA